MHKHLFPSCLKVDNTYRTTDSPITNQSDVTRRFKASPEF